MSQSVALLPSADPADLPILTTKRGTRARGIHLHPRSRAWCFVYRDPDSRKWKHKSTGLESPKQAQAYRRKFLGDLDQGLLPTEMRRWTVDAAVHHYIEHLKATDHHTRTVRFISALLGAVKRKLGGRRLEEINNPVLKTYQAQRMQDGVSSQSVNRELQYLFGILREANLEDRAKRHYKRLPTEKSTVGKALTPEQTQHLLRTAQENEDWNVVGWCAMLAFHSAMRGGEIKSTRLGFVEMGPKPSVKVYLRDPYDKRRRGTKTAGGERIVPLNSAARWAMERLLQWARHNGSTLPEHFLLPGNLSRHTKPIDPLNGKRGYDPELPQQTWATAWRNLTAAAKASWDLKHPKEPFPENFRFHDCRHTALTRLAERGVPIQHAQEIAGQLDPQTTRIYLHIQDHVLRAAVDAIDSTNLPEVATEPQTRTVQ